MPSKKLALAIGGAVAAIGAALYVNEKNSVPQAAVTSAAEPILARSEPVVIDPKTAVQETIASGEMTSEDQRKIELLHEILRSKNDNDPRMDTELRDLSQAARAQLREEYRVMPKERLNQRGTILFLLGRNATAEDAKLLRAVISEPICKSLADCAKSDEAASADDEHQLGNSVTLQYPHLVAMRGISRYFEKASASEREQFTETLEAAAKSDAGQVAAAASEILKKR